MSLRILYLQFQSALKVPYTNTTHSSSKSKQIENVFEQDFYPHRNFEKKRKSQRGQNSTFFKYDKVWHNVTLNSFVSAMQAISNCDSLIRLTNSKKPHRLSTRGDQFFLESVFLFRRRKWLLFSQLALTTKIENGEVWHCISTSEARLLTIRFENCILQQNT